LYGQQFEILNYRHSWGEYRVSFYQTPDHVRILPAAWTSLAHAMRNEIAARRRCGVNRLHRHCRFYRFRGFRFRGNSASSQKTRM
jgi:hypothetical protein